MDSGNGYCATDTYKTTTYCSCVNSPITCPMIASSTCANSGNSYKNMAMIPGSDQYTYCSNHPICVNIASVGGSQNIVSGVAQQCGVIENIQNTIQNNPIAFGGIIFLLFVVFAIIISSSINSTGLKNTSQHSIT